MSDKKNAETYPGGNGEDQAQRAAPPNPFADVQHIVSFTGPDGTDIRCVVPQIVALSTRKPQDAGEKWHEDPPEQRRVEFTIHSLGLNQTLLLSLAEAKKVADDITQRINVWYHWSVTTPKGLLLPPPHVKIGPEPDIQLPDEDTKPS